MNEYAGRIARLQTALREQGAALAVLGDTDQMLYLTGWVSKGHERLLALFVPAEGEAAFVVPALNAAQARTNPAGITRVIDWGDAGGWSLEVQSLFSEWQLGEGVALIDGELFSEHLLSLQNLFSRLRYQSASVIMTRLRERKTDGELASLQKAADLIDTIFEESVLALKEGMTEAEMQEFVLAAIRNRDSEPSFTPLICFGANTALPHHHSGPTRLAKGDMVVIDIGCRSDGYCSDITRTVAFGEPRDPEAANVYDIVSRAHWAAREAAKPGVTCEAVDRAARQVIVDSGYGEYFIHRTGHGIGLSGHEPPSLVGGNTMPLVPAMCFSIEPGIYLPERFGVRIENIVTTTETGLRSLNVDPAPQLRVV